MNTTTDDDLPPAEPGADRDGDDEYGDGHGESHGVSYVNIDDAEAARSRPWIRTSVWLLSIFILITFVSLPLVRIFIWADDGPSDHDSAARDARSFVATRFTADALEARSVSLAQRWVQPELAETVEQIVGRLQATAPDLIAGSTARVARAACREPAPNNAECFHAWLARAGQPELIRVELVIGIIDGTATIIGLQTVASV